MSPASTGPDETGPAAAAPPAPTTYEAARDELVEVVRRLESGGVALDESLALWERGEQLAVLCEQWLDGAKARVESARGRREPDEG